MAFFYEYEKREFVRMSTAVPVDYKFIAQGPGIEVPDDLLKGETRNLGAGGILLCGALPDSELTGHLLMQKAAVVVRIHLPGEAEPIQAITRVAWIEAVSQGDNTCCFGLSFREITSEAQSMLFRFIINAQMG